MRILLITDSYPPEVRVAAQLMKDLAEGFNECGYQLTVATTMPGYNLAVGTRVENIPREENVRGVQVVRIPTLPHHRVNYIIRGINQILLPRIFTAAVKKTISGPFDVVIVHSPPLPLALAASNLAKYYNAKFIANVHDIFPQNGIDLVSWWQKPLIKVAFGWMEKLVYKRADIIIVPSGNHARYLEERRKVLASKLSVISHWIDAAPFDSVSVGDRFRKMWGLENNFIFFFGGVLGPSQGLEMVLDAAESFRDDPTVKFLFVGDGGAKPKLEKIVKDKNLSNVIFKPFVSSEEYPALVKEMDVGFVTLTSKNTTPAVPGKLTGYMAASIPAVVAVHKESDAIRIVNEAQCGFAVVSDNHEAVVNTFRTAYENRASLKTLGENGRRYLDENFTKEKLIGEWNRIIRENI